MTELLSKYDAWISEDGPAALYIREPLMPVEGADGVIFPATFAASEDRTFKGGYNIDPRGEDPWNDGGNVCLVDSVGSQANRIEPIFCQERYASLVPQIVVQAGSHEVSILEAGHRAGDALVRCSSLQQELHDAFRSVLKGDCEPLAKIAPTSLVFGVWDSRDTQAKLPRLISSTIRAYDVKRLTRSAQYVPAVQYVEEELLSEPQDKKVKDAYSERGFIHVPASGSHGGVIATGGIRRDATLSLAALRLISVKGDAEKTQSLRRYILGLAVTAFTYSPTGYLRQGCNLVCDPENPREFVEVHGDGQRVPVPLSHAEALEYSQATADAFGVGESQTIPFDVDRAKQDVAGEKKTKKKTAKKKSQGT